jgi:hypothetical protein
MRDVKLDDWEIKTLITIVDHVRNQATGSGVSNYAIDVLCRQDCSNRWFDLRQRLASYVGARVESVGAKKK